MDSELYRSQCIPGYYDAQEFYDALEANDISTWQLLENIKNVIKSQDD